MLNPKNNAHIAMERFKVQSYNWDKSTTELQKIYGVGTKFIVKMRKTVGVPAPKDRLKVKCDKAMALFKCTREHHKLGYRQIKDIYGVSESWAKKMIRDVVGTGYQRRLKEMNDLVYNHPDFGIPGEQAPTPQKDFAKKLGVNCHVVGSRRRARGVLPYKVPKDWLSEPEKRAYELCKLTHNWKRAEGIDRHLESLRE